MKNAEITFKIPVSVLNSLNQNIEEFTVQSRLFIALQLFKKHKVTAKQAAMIAGIEKEKFIDELDRFNIDFINYEPTELEEELEKLKE